MPNRHICFIQTHYTDLSLHEDPEHNLLEKIKQSMLFDEIILAAADIEENKVLRKFAKTNGVKYLLGSVRNIVERMNHVIDEYNADFLYRVLLNWHYIDTELLKKMKKKVNSYENLDFMCLPYDFDMRFGCDVISANAIKKLLSILDNNKALKERFAFRPWFYFEAERSFHSTIFSDTPVYSNEKFYSLRKKLLSRSPTAWDYGASYSYSDYDNLSEYLSPNDVVLDLSCGYGNGTFVIADKCKIVYGYDVIEDHIDYAKKSLVEKSFTNVNFILGPKERLRFKDGFFDKVISVHTMEHVEDDKAFIKEIYRVLKIGGLLLITVPLRIRKPFAGNDEPLIPATEQYPGQNLRRK